jgi:hypothetical protein
MSREPARQGSLTEGLRQADIKWRQPILKELQGEAAGHLRRDLDVPQLVWELCGIY